MGKNTNGENLSVESEKSSVAAIDNESYIQRNNGDRSSLDSSKGKNESQESVDDNDTVKHLNDSNQQNGHDVNSDDDDDIDDQHNEEHRPQSPSQQQQQQHQADIRIHVVPMVVNGNANEVRTSVRLSGDGEQGL
ncbi:hypothetical protein BLA29_005757 [Euroglyphus maynei]|uniref:Uncharacterized protein n=1 Tax=Euroglyphus maynei TaxID=6958 RepID=A0A1Y3BUL6_EURMA|nr:hypothetical protein BLA29_005757 [Euroglyphus maynei]